MRTLWLEVAALVLVLAAGSVSVSASPGPGRETSRLRALRDLAESLVDKRARPVFLPTIPDFQFNISAECRQALEELVQPRNESWPLKMLDASTKIPDGLAYGNLVHMGNYDECIAITEDETGLPWAAQHCLITFTAEAEAAVDDAGAASSLDDMRHRVATGDVTSLSGEDLVKVLNGIPIKVAWCVPEVCSPGDLQNIAGSLVHGSFVASVQENECHTHRRQGLRGIDIFALCLLACFVVIAAISTAYDFLTLNRGRRIKLLLPFSVLSNWPRLIATSEPTVGEEQIYCLNGIRFISICWVVLGHVYLVNAGLPSVNAVYMRDFIKAFSRLTIMNATVSVDTFFLMSGLLLSFLFLKEVQRTNRFNVLKFYIHRYVRLTPALAILLLLSVTLLRYSGDGPLWESRYDPVRENCEDNWWTNILYVNNFVNPQNMCLGHTWYLAVDMQLHWLSPLILIPLWKRPRLGAYWLLFLMAAGWAIPFTIVYLKELYPGTYVGPAGKRNETQKEYYWPTYTRYNTWLVGLALGAILRHARVSQPKLHPVAITCGWILSTVFMMGAVNAAYPFQQPGYDYNRVEAAFWLSLFRFMWALGLAWIIFACDQGFGGLPNIILSWKLFQPLARLSYGIYLTHISILYLFSGTIRAPIYLADVVSIPEFFSVSIMGIAWTIPLTLLFESPVIGLEKLVFGGGGRPPVAVPEDQPNGFATLENSSSQSSDKSTP